MMFSYYPADASYVYDSWWIERLMIDTNFQNMRYGKEVLIQGIHWFDQNISENVLRISAVKTNDVALKLYEKLSFIRTWEGN